MDTVGGIVKWAINSAVFADEVSKLGLDDLESSSFMRQTALEPTGDLHPGLLAQIKDTAQCLKEPRGKSLPVGRDEAIIWGSIQWPFEFSKLSPT